MGLWGQAGVPRKGWACVGVDDLGAPSHTCVMCDNEAVRYVHHMTHPDHPGSLAVGCICAGHMAEGYNAEAADREMKNRAARRSRWLDGWKTSRKGNAFRKKGGRLFTVGVKNGRWWAGCDGAFLTGDYMSEAEAMYALFDWANRIDPGRFVVAKK